MSFSCEGAESLHIQSTGPGPMARVARGPGLPDHRGPPRRNGQLRLRRPEVSTVTAPPSSTRQRRGDGPAREKKPETSQIKDPQAPAGSATEPGPAESCH